MGGSGVGERQVPGPLGCQRSLVSLPFRRSRPEWPRPVCAGGFRRDGGAARGSSWAPRPGSPLCCATSLPHCKMAAGPPGPGPFRDPSRSAITRHGHTEQPPRCRRRPAVACLRRPGALWTPGGPSPVRESLPPAPDGSALRAAASPSLHNRSRVEQLRGG